MSGEDSRLNEPSDEWEKILVDQEDFNNELEDKATKFNMTAIQNVMRDRRVITLAQTKVRDVPLDGEGIEAVTNSNNSSVLKMLDLDLPFTRLRKKQQSALGTLEGETTTEQQQDQALCATETNACQPKQEKGQESPLKSRIFEDSETSSLSINTPLNPGEEVTEKGLFSIGGSHVIRNKDGYSSSLTSDEDFVFDMEQLDDDDEEYRDDKAVRVSQKEYQNLIETVEPNPEVDINSFFIVSKNVPTSPPPPYVSPRVDYGEKTGVSGSINQDSGVGVCLSLEQRSTIKLLLKQHIVLLTTIAMQCSLYEHLMDVANSSVNLIQEFFHFTPREEGENVTVPNTLQLEAFSDVGAEEALQVLDRWRAVASGTSIPVYLDERLNVIHRFKSCGWETSRLAGSLTLPHLPSSKLPALSLRMMATMMMEPFFGRFPALLPRIGVSTKNTKRCQRIQSLPLSSATRAGSVNTLRDVGTVKPGHYYLELCTYKNSIKYSQAEDFLIILGYYQWGNNWPCLQLNLLPTRNYAHMRNRFKAHAGSIKIPKGCIYELPTSHIIQKTCQFEESSFCGSDICLYYNDRIVAGAGRENDLIIPAWVTSIKLAGATELVHIAEDHQLKSFSVLLEDEMPSDHPLSVWDPGYAVVPLSQVMGCILQSSCQATAMKTRRFANGGTLLPFVTSVLDHPKGKPYKLSSQYATLHECYAHYEERWLHASDSLNKPLLDRKRRRRRVSPRLETVEDQINNHNHKEAITTLNNYLSTELNSDNVTESQQAGCVLNYMAGMHAPIERVRFWTIYLQELHNITLLLDQYSSEEVIKLFQLLLNLASAATITAAEIKRKIPAINWDSFVRIPFRSSPLEPSILASLQSCMKNDCNKNTTRLNNQHSEKSDRNDNPTKIHEGHHHKESVEYSTSNSVDSRSVFDAHLTRWLKQSDVAPNDLCWNSVKNHGWGRRTFEFTRTRLQNHREYTTEQLFTRYLELAAGKFSENQFHQK